MAEPRDPDREAGQPRLPPSNNSSGSNEGLSEDDLDIDTLVAVWKDDQLLDAIGRAPDGCGPLDVPFDVSADRHLIEALLAIRHNAAPDLLAPDCPDRVGNARGVPVVRARHRHKLRVPLVSTLAATVVLTFTALAAYGATPDQALWPITEVLYGQHAASISAADDAVAAQAQAEAAMAAGRTPQAEAALHAAASRIPQVRSEDGQNTLQNRQRDLERRLDAPPGPAEPDTRARGPKTSVAPGSAAQRTTRSSRPEVPADRAKKSHDSTTHTGSRPTTSPTHPPARPTPTSSTSPQRGTQPGKPPPTTRSATATTTRSAPRTARTDTGATPDGAQVAEPTKLNTEPPHTPRSKVQPPSAPSTGQEARPSPSVRPTEQRHKTAITDRSNPPAPTRRPHATPAPDSEPP